MAVLPVTAVLVIQLTIACLAHFPGRRFPIGPFGRKIIPLPHHFPIGPFGGKIGPLPGQFPMGPWPAYFPGGRFPYGIHPSFFGGPRGPVVFPRLPVLGMVFKGRWGAAPYPSPQQSMLSPSPVLGPYTRGSAFLPELHNRNGPVSFGTGIGGRRYGSAATSGSGVGIGIGIGVGGTSGGNIGLGVGAGIGASGSPGLGGLNPTVGRGNGNHARPSVGTRLGISVGSGISEIGGYGVGLGMGIAGRNGGGVGRGSRLGLGSGYFSNRFGVGPGNGLRGANGGRSGSGIGVGVGIGISTAGNRGFRTTGYPFRGVSGAGRFGLGSGIGVGIAQRNIRGPILLPSGGFGSAGANSRLRTSARGLGIGTGLGVGSGINIGAERGRVITPPGVMTNFGEPISGTGSRSGNDLATGFRDRGFANGGQIRGVGHAGNGLQITRGTRSGVGIGVGVGVGIGVGGGSSVRRSGVQVPGLIADTGFGIPTYGTGINGISGVGLGVGAGGSNVGVESGIGGLHTNGQMIGGAGGGSFGMGVGLGVEIGGTVDVSGKETTAGNILSMGGSNNIIEVIGPFFGSSGIGTGSKLIQGFDISMLEVQGVGAGPYSNTGMVNGGGNGMGIVMGSTSQGGNALGIPSGIGLGSQSSGMGTGGNGHASGTSIGGNGGGSAGGGVFGYLGGGGGGGGSGFVGDFASSLGRDVHHPRGYNVTNNIIIGPDAEVSENSLFGNSGHGTIV